MRRVLGESQGSGIKSSKAGPQGGAKIASHNAMAKIAPHTCSVIVKISPHNARVATPQPWVSYIVSRIPCPSAFAIIACGMGLACLKLCPRDDGLVRFQHTLQIQCRLVADLGQCVITKMIITARLVMQA